MPDNKHEVIWISRLLTPKHKEELLALVKLAFKAESLLGKTSSLEVSIDSVNSPNAQEYPCENSIDKE